MSSRKGKLTGSPYHVENIRYKYAVERGEETTVTLKSYSDCRYYESLTKRCLLWNSGYKFCTGFECKYYYDRLRQPFSCVNCAFRNTYAGKLKCRKKEVNINGIEASYCVFFEQGQELSTPVKVSLKDQLLNKQAIRQIKQNASKTSFQGKKFVLTGKYKLLRREDYVEILYALGASLCLEPANTEYVIVAPGKKTERLKVAQKSAEKGRNIQFISEESFVEMMKEIGSSFQTDENDLRK